MEDIIKLAVMMALFGGVGFALIFVAERIKTRNSPLHVVAIVVAIGVILLVLYLLDPENFISGLLAPSDPELRWRGR